MNRLSRDILKDISRHPNRREFSRIAGAIVAGAFGGAALPFENEIDHPAVPELASVNARPPARSASVELEKSPRRLLMYANSDNSGKSARVSDTPNAPTPNSPAKLLEYWDHQPPAYYVMTLREFWRPVPETWEVLNPGQTKSVTFQKSEGISQTDSESITATLGLGSSNGPLSASISATYSHSITTEHDRSFSDQKNVAAPPDGMQRVWMLWQLVHEFVALTPDGKVLPAGCRCPQDRKAEIQWIFQGVHSGAWVYYEATQWQFPSKIYQAYQRDFPIRR